MPTRMSQLFLRRPRQRVLRPLFHASSDGVLTGAGAAHCRDSGDGQSDVQAAELLAPLFPIQHEFTEHLFNARPCAGAWQTPAQGRGCPGGEQTPRASWRALHLLY